MSYRVWRFTPFSPNDGCYGHFHGIVWLNDLIFCTSVHLGVANNVAEESFYFLCTKKSFLIFRVQKMGFFVKDLPNICSKIEPQLLNKILDHMLFTNQMVGCRKVSIHLSWKRHISADSIGIGSNLNCRCFVVCSRFFEKIILRYTSTYFIRYTTLVLQDSTPRYERSCPPFWPFWSTHVHDSFIFIF